ncbi:MAG: ABC transporter permease [Candidatus Thermofonsia Clade 1 bacterium]|uniref:ABC transporter permease n=1 Tax=Candidatus Thermofonsia Clade 1 bacterium TaxID=2364210 RepID=A0A2M8PXL1_9CHLR|nr:MAG: ABC transporter permease [Candidatus Thermofonsia Clade 1 bacterium]PJF42283.1 MAG: ABC transporter permease [Candidatus Thermofonsia Clade 1 bacterium]RMF52587.1 MAG: ABC transporter permease [Chloroflexota bacterium]
MARRGRLLRRLWHDAPLSSIGALGVIGFLLLALIGPYLTPYNPTANSLSERNQPPSLAHPFGTDNFGRDILSRIIYGGRNIFALTGSATLIAVGLGLVIGLYVGYLGGWLDQIVMRLADALLALPSLLLTLVLLGALGNSRFTVLVAIVILYVPIVTRVVRSVVLDVKTKAYIEAAEIGGESRFHILFREIMPAVLPTLAVEGALRFSYAIFLVASLGFLGLGVARPEPDWGLMVSEARDWYALSPHILFFPSAAIVVLVVCVNLMADGLRRLLEYSEAD